MLPQCFPPRFSIGEIEPIVAVDGSRRYVCEGCSRTEGEVRRTGYLMLEPYVLVDAPLHDSILILTIGVGCCYTDVYSASINNFLRICSSMELMQGGMVELDLALSRWFLAFVGGYQVNTLVGRITLKRLHDVMMVVISCMPSGDNYQRVERKGVSVFC